MRLLRVLQTALPAKRQQEKAAEGFLQGRAAQGGLAAARVGPAAALFLGQEEAWEFLPLLLAGLAHSFLEWEALTRLRILPALLTVRAAIFFLALGERAYLETLRAVVPAAGFPVGVPARLQEGVLAQARAFLWAAFGEVRAFGL